MRIIAHRGLIDGPDAEMENRPDVLQHALDQGFEIELDVWYKDGQWFAGHDAPQYELDIRFVFNRRSWLHCKNHAALDSLVHHRLFVSPDNVNAFWHDHDDYTLTTKGYIWTYPGRKLTATSIQVLPEWHDPTLSELRHSPAYGVCTDYALRAKEVLQS